MGQEINFLDSVPKVMRDIDSRKANKEHNRRIANAFGQEYFDGPREQGYGGYYYDGRWQSVAARLIDAYGLEVGARVLDVGCAKGFLVKDFRDALPGLEAFGVDVSAYALQQAPAETAPYLMRADCRALPFDDASFDLVLAINTVHNLEPSGCLQALKELERVSRGNAFVQVDAYRNESERELFEEWMLTAKTWLRPEGWFDLFEAAGYTGDYYWTILLQDGSVA